MLQVRHAVGQREQLVDLLLVLGEHQPRLAVVEKISGFLVEHIAIEPEAQGPDGVGRHFGRDPIGPVVADDADDIVAAEAQLDHAEREIVHARLVVVPGEGAPQAEVLFAQRDLAAVLFGVEPQHFRIGVGLRDPGGVIHHAAFSATCSLSSGSTSASSSSPR